jgi:hypothetical protein
MLMYAIRAYLESKIRLFHLIDKEIKPMNIKIVTKLKIALPASCITVDLSIIPNACWTRISLDESIPNSLIRLLRVPSIRPANFSVAPLAIYKYQRNVIENQKATIEVLILLMLFTKNIRSQSQKANNKNRNM